MLPATCRSVYIVICIKENEANMEKETEMISDESPVGDRIPEMTRVQVMFNNLSQV